MTTSNNGLPVDIIEALAKSNLTGSQHRIINAIWLFQSEPVSSLDIASFTGLQANHVREEIRHLVKYKVVHRNFDDVANLGRGMKPHTTINANTNEWEIPTDLSKKVLLPAHLSNNKGIATSAPSGEKGAPSGAGGPEKGITNGAPLGDKGIATSAPSGEKGAPSGAPLLDNNYTKEELTALIMKLIDEREFDDTINEIFRENLDEFVEEYHSPVSWVTEAFDEAKKYKAYNWGYVKTILTNWQRRGKPDKLKSKHRKEPRQIPLEGEII